jgi:phage terminase large subunit-like protein
MSESSKSSETLALRHRLMLLEELQSLRQEKERRASRRKILQYFPDSGPLRRELYAKHLEFFSAGKQYRERLMLAANRVGKTEGVGGFELALHLTGDYPDWWIGRKFDRGVRAWAAGDTSITVRDILQQKLLGPVGNWGTGLIPGDSIKRIVRKSGLPDTAEVIYVQHKRGTSFLVLKSYEQRREAFQGTEQDVIWLDEEPPLDIYTECLMRTMTSDGMVMLTFTPLLGMSEVVLAFLPDGKMEADTKVSGSKFIVMATWDDAPHLTQQAKDELWASIPPYQRDARSKGIPQLGSGAIYPVPESDIVVAPFAIPDYWPRGYGFDVGWNCTAAVWGAHDRDNHCVYLTHCYKRGQAEPAVHAAAIKAVGAWIPGFIDPASRGRSQADGKQLLSDYRELGLKLSVADNGVESGLYSTLNRMSIGGLKVFSTCQQWMQEFRLYRRDDSGRVVKANDHAMDATRYLESRVNQMITKPVTRKLPFSTQPASAWS